MRRVDGRINGCLGFAVFRKTGAPDAGGAWHALPAWVGFVGQDNEAWQPKTTEIWPVQKFEWKDLTAKRGGTYSYRIVPVSGDPAAEAALTHHDDRALLAGPATLTPERGSAVCYFNRGILSTQFLAHAIPAGPSGAPNYVTLKGHIDTPGDALRESLAGQIIEGLTALLDKAATEGGSVYAALYELADRELVAALVKHADRLHLILSNTGRDDTETRDARKQLHDSTGNVTPADTAPGRE